MTARKPLKPPPRSATFLLRLTAAEKRMLERLALRAGLSSADVLRQLLRDEHRQHFPKLMGYPG